MTEDSSTNDIFEFMQKMWNPLNFPIPGMLTPTVDVGEIEKKIRDLKAVENWLTMNLGFLQMTIRTLELQKTALETLNATGKDAKGETP
jgi:hypothetical protein